MRREIEPARRAPTGSGSGQRSGAPGSGPQRPRFQRTFRRRGTRQYARRPRRPGPGRRIHRSRRRPPAKPLPPVSYPVATSRIAPALGLLLCLSGFARAGNPFTLVAPAFAQGKLIPPQYARAGQNISPELQIANVPAAARSLVLICDDPDSPHGLWTHWLVWNLPALSHVPLAACTSAARKT